MISTPKVGGGKVLNKLSNTWKWEDSLAAYFRLNLQRSILQSMQMLTGCKNLPMTSVWSVDRVSMLHLKLTRVELENDRESNPVSTGEVHLCLTMLSSLWWIYIKINNIVNIGYVKHSKNSSKNIQSKLISSRIHSR